MVARISPSAAGLALWSIAAASVAAPLMSRVLLLGPLVVASALLARMPHDRRGFGLPLRRLGGWSALVAALPLIVAVALPAGPVAAALTLPWLAVAFAGVVVGVSHGLRRLPSLFHPRHASELGSTSRWVSSASEPCS